VSDAKTLLLTETGIARHEVDGEAVNVGPIVVALRFLTEGRGDDRGIDDEGAPLPDLLGLAFDVVRSIILGGADGEYFREVKQQFDARAAGGGAWVGLARRATVARAAPLTSVTRAHAELRSRLKRLDEAAAQLDLELEVLQGGKRPPRPRKAKKVAEKAERQATAKKAERQATAKKAERRSTTKAQRKATTKKAQRRKNARG
jgi:hypothetical protein